MTLPVGINKTLTIARETTFGALSSASGQLLRRVNESMNLSIDNFVNQEILPSGQYRDIRHGVKRPAGTLSGNLAPAAYKEIFQNLLRQDFATVPMGLTTAISTIVATVPNAGAVVFTRGSGSFITDGHLVGDTVRCTGWTTSGVSNNNVNFTIVLLTATAMTCYGGGVAKVAGDPVTIFGVGHRTFIPPASQTDTSFTLERNFTDAALVETFQGCKVSQISLNIPASGFVSINAQIMAQSMVTGTSSNFPTPSALATSPAIDASNGILDVGISGLPQGVVNITGIQMQISQQMQAQPAVGTNIVPFLPRGRLMVSGQLTAYFVDATYRDIFINEVLSSLLITATTSPAANADFVSFYMPVVKFQSADKSDSDSAIFQTISFTALENATGTAGTVPSTIMVQDSQA